MREKYSRAALAPAQGARYCGVASPSAPTLESAPSLESAVDAPTVEPQHSGTTQRLQAISPVNQDVVWASGLGGTFVVTTNGAATLQFGDVHGVTAKVAYLLAAGVGSDSRIYKTVDGGESWERQFTADNPAAFYDCFDFWAPRRGLVMGDVINGRLPVLRTRSGGENWFRIGRNLPPAQPGEAAFAASGTCVETLGTEHAWIATGAAASARILATTDGGETWKSYPTPIQPQGTPTSGLTTVAFRRRRRAANRCGAGYGLSYANGSVGDHLRTVVITGPGGAAWTLNEGRRWHRYGGEDPEGQLLSTLRRSLAVLGMR